MEKQLRRSKQGSVLGGVAGGLAQHFNIDVVIVRLLFVISLFISFGVSLFAYIILWVVLPEEPFYHFGGPADKIDENEPGPVTPPAPTGNSTDKNLKVIAIGLIGFGTYMLLDQYIVWYSLGKFFWPIALIGLGAFLLLRKRDQDYESNYRENTGQPNGGGVSHGPEQTDISNADKTGSSPGDPEKEGPDESFKVN